jgi:hypothetical protein
MDRASEDQLVADFENDGFCVIPSVVSASEASTLRSAVLEEQRLYPEHFRLLGQSRDGGGVGEHGRWQSGVTMHATDAFDQLAAHPVVLSLVRRLVGPQISITGPGTAGIRDTPHEPAPRHGQPWPVGGNGAVAPWGEDENGIMWQMWHREQGGLFAPHHPRCITSLQVRWQFNDTTAMTTCVSAVPESVEEKTALAWAPLLMQDGTFHQELAQLTEPFVDHMWRNRSRHDMHLHRSGVDIYAKAGDVILLNNTNIHAGTVRAGSPMRVDFRVDYCLHGSVSQGRAATGDLATQLGSARARELSYGGGGVPIPTRFALAHPELIDLTPPPSVSLAKQQPAKGILSGQQAGGHVTSPVERSRSVAGSCTAQQIEAMTVEEITAEARHAHVVAAVEKLQRELARAHKL